MIFPNLCNIYFTAMCCIDDVWMNGFTRNASHHVLSSIYIMRSLRHKLELRSEKLQFLDIYMFNSKLSLRHKHVTHRRILLKEYSYF